MAIQEVRRKATSIEVSFGQSELSTDIADDGAKIGRVDSQFAAVQLSIQNHCAQHGHRFAGWVRRPQS